MPRNDRIQLTYRLTFSTPFHCGTGLRVGLIDRTIVRDHDKYLFVPGSTIKGILRERCEQVARLYEEFDEEMLDAIASPHDEKRALWEPGHAPTMVTRIFGSHSLPGHLYFDDARQSDKVKAEYDSKEKDKKKAKGKYTASQVDIYTQMRMDRPTRTAARGALFTSEFGIKGLIFEGTISGWLKCTEIEMPENDIVVELPENDTVDKQPDNGSVSKQKPAPTYSLLLLVAGLHLLDRLGGNKSMGKGQCQCEITELQCGGITYEKEQWQAWLDHLEALSFYSTMQEEKA